MPDENFSVAESLNAAFDQYESESSDAPGDAPAPVEADEGEQPSEDIADEVTPEDEAGEGAEEQPQEEPSDEEKPAIEGEAIEAPQNWAAADRETFSKLDPAGQEFLLRRHKDMEADYTRKMQDISEFRREYEPVNQLFEPHMQALKQQGLSPAHLIHRWAGIAQNLEQNPQQTLMHLAQQYGVNLGESSGDNTQEFKNPEVEALKQQLNTLTNSLTQREQSEMQTRTQSFVDQISKFENEKTEAGELAHPYLNEVFDDMVNLAKAEKAAGRTPGIKDLYEKAVWMNPSIREKQLSSQRQAEEKKRNEEARQKAAKAKKASKSVSSPGVTSPAVELSLREQLSQALD